MIHGMTGSKENHDSCLEEDNSRQKQVSSCSRPLLLERMNRVNREGLERNAAKLTQGRRQRHSAPDIFYGRTSEIQELRERHEQAKKKTTPAKRYTGKRAQLPSRQLDFERSTTVLLRWLVMVKVKKTSQSERVI